MKKVWKKPELVVLYRGKPEESVLQNCKGGATTGPVSFFSGCNTIESNSACLTSRCSAVASFRAS
jgi:hypothetical protein